MERILKLFQITLVVPDYDTAIAFYRDRMGFELVEDTDLGQGKRWVVVRPGAAGADILLARAVSDPQIRSIGNQTGGRVAFFLESDDFAADHARLTAAGVTFLEAPRHESYGSVVVFEDPFGNKWDLIQRA
ncbi:VOC family protein [Maricaulis sp. D1M11]|uniref:VOC family protein n=1 Tax=Maricaulis sp. D1M11 TaxID=3076117 RepID=UPI0039B398E0